MLSDYLITRWTSGGVISARERRERTPEEVQRGIEVFEEYVEVATNRSVHAPEGSGPHACPCCGYLTLDSRGWYQICPVCFWEDDGQDDHDADDIRRGGPNYGLSLTQARLNFRQIGACRERVLPYVRPPQCAELPAGTDPAPPGREPD
ncbi:CPCC family cysteine-rich protein [Microbispora sp. ZYX-F-249]|uniref:CPCC family cysteine-rich protein n=1 Tax=Microbispora maris TaxID=3144104 RepID=A0ABV0AZZ3_9ACTN